MDKIIIEHSPNLSGSISISGSKNSSLPILAATLMSGGNYKIENVPEISDVITMLKLIRRLGGEYSFDNGKVEINTEGVNSFEAPYELVKTMRASVLVWGALLGRFGKAKISFPGGCAIGDRPVDQHIKAFDSLGYKTDINDGYLETSKVSKTGGVFEFETKSVTGCENAIIASILADKKTIIKNCALEPEVGDLISFLKFLGAKIEVSGSTVEIMPSSSLSSGNGAYSVIPDRIEAGTFAVLGSLPGNNIKILNCSPNHLIEPLECLKKSGPIIESKENEMTIKGAEEILPINLVTEPYPGFPTDLQAQFMILALLANGKSTFHETIFPSRFIHVAELRKLGADIEVNNSSATIFGGKSLAGSKMQASDLRASASLVLAGIVSKGRSEISRVYHLDRGYEKIDYKLTELGVKIWREKE